MDVRPADVLLEAGLAGELEAPLELVETQGDPERSSAVPTVLSAWTSGAVSPTVSASAAARFPQETAAA
jgi:hypothetical protein